MLSVNGPLAESTEEEVKPKTKRGKSKATTAKKPSRKKVEPPSSVDSDTEAKISLPKRGRKRSNSVSREPVVLFDGRDDTPENPSPPPKRRVTATESAPKPSDNEEMEEEDTSLLQNANIQSPKKRAPIQSTSIMSARSKRTVEYDPEGQIMDFDQALSDAEEPSTYQKPFIRQTRRTTRSRTSMMAQGQQLLPTPAARGRTPVAATVDPARPPPPSIKKNFFRESGQDFSLPVKVPRHLAEPESPTAAHAQSEGEESAPEIPPPEIKKGRGRPKRAAAKTAKERAPKAKRGKGPRQGADADGDETMLSEQRSHVGSDNEDGPEEIGESDHTTPRQNAPERMDIDGGQHGVDDRDTMSESGSVVRHPQRETPARDEESEGEEEYQEPEPAPAPHRSGDPALSDRGDELTDDDPVEGFDTEIPDAPSEYPSAHRVVSQALVPFNGPESPTRRPLSPIRKQVQVAVRTTPRPKQSTSLVTSESWSPVDLDIVFIEAEGASSFEDDGLSSAEREMTVEEWVKWKAATAEQRLRETAERMVQRFEESGQRALAAIEGIAVQ